MRKIPLEQRFDSLRSKMYVELEIIDGRRVCVRGNSKVINNDLIVESEVVKLQPCKWQINHGKFDTMELVMTSPPQQSQMGPSWTDSTTKLMKMDIIAVLEKEGFKIVTASIDQGREMLMMYKE